MTIPQTQDSTGPAPITLFVEPVSPSRALELASTAKHLASEVATFHPNSLEFSQRLDDVRTLAAQEVTSTSNAGSRLLERTVAQANRSGGDASKRVAHSLNDLRTVVSDLAPGGNDKTGFQKFLSKLPGGRNVGRWLQKYETYKEQLDAIVKALESGKDELLRDNAALLIEQQELRENMRRLQDYIVLADQLDAAVEAEIAKQRAAGNTQGADALEQEVLFEVRQRARNLRVQMATADQGYLSMDLVRKNNIELAKGVEATQTVTISAMRTAIMVASALETQGLVAEQNQRTREATEAMLVRNSQLLKQQGAAIQAQVSSSPVSIEALDEAFKNISDAIHDVETFRATAVKDMQASITQLDSQLAQARPYVERATAVEGAQNQARGALER